MIVNIVKFDKSEVDNKPWRLNLRVAVYKNESIF
jgi:hypothetical protein